MKIAAGATTTLALWLLLASWVPAALADDILSWEADSICVGTPARMTLDNGTAPDMGPRCGLEFVLRYEPTLLAVDSVRVGARAVDLNGSKFHVPQPGTLIGVMFDANGPGAIAEGTGAIAEIFFSPVAAFEGYAPVIFEEVLVADANAHPVVVSSLALQVCVVGVEISELVAEQIDDGSVRISWSVTPGQDLDGFDVLRSVDSRSGGYSQVNSDRVRGDARVVFVDGSESVKAGGRFFYKLLVHERTGETTAYGPIEVLTQDRTLPVAFALHQNFPNPLTGSAVFSYDVPRAENVSLRIYDVAGRLVRSLIDGKQAPGRHRVVWDRRSGGGSHVASGIYLARMRTLGFTASRKVVVR